MLSLLVALLAGPAFSAPLGVSSEGDLGIFQENETKVRTIWLENQSAEPVYLTKFSPSCSCTSITVDGSWKIEPRSRRAVTVSIIFGSLIGAFQTTIGIDYLAQGKNESTSVTFRGRVEASALLSAGSIDFGELPADSEDVVKTIVVSHGNGARWDSLSAEAPGPGVKIDIAPAGRTWLLSARISPKLLLLGQNRAVAQIYFHRAGAKSPGWIKVPISAMVLGDIRAHPSSVYFGLVDLASASTAALKVSSKNVDLTSLRAECDAKDVTVTVQKAGRNEGTIVLQWTPVHESGPLSSRLHISVPGYARALEIAVLGMARRSDDRPTAAAPSKETTSGHPTASRTASE